MVGNGGGCWGCGCWAREVGAGEVGAGEGNIGNRVLKCWGDRMLRGVDRVCSKTVFPCFPLFFFQVREGATDLPLYRKPVAEGPALAKAKRLSHTNDLHISLRGLL